MSGNRNGGCRFPLAVFSPIAWISFRLRPLYQCIAAGSGESIDAAKPNPQQSAKFQDASIALATAPPGETHGKPYLVARCHAIDTLQHEFEIECELELAHHYERRLLAAQCHEIIAANLAFDLKA